MRVASSTRSPERASDDDAYASGLRDAGGGAPPALAPLIAPDGAETMRIVLVEYVGYEDLRAHGYADRRDVAKLARWCALPACDTLGATTLRDSPSGACKRRMRDGCRRARRTRRARDR